MRLLRRDVLREQHAHVVTRELEVACRDRGPGAWLVGDRLTQADITVACISTFLGESLGVVGGDARYPALHAHVPRCEALPEFRATDAAWFAAAIKD